jgi:MFS family permease
VRAAGGQPLDEEKLTCARTSPRGMSPTSRLFACLFAGYLTIFAFYSGIGLLVQNRIGDEEPHRKALALGLVSAAGAVSSTLSNPIGGSLSDRTVSRFGRRTPWLIGGSVTALLATLPLSRADSMVEIGLFFCLALAMANVYQAALTAIVPDQVKRELRGKASSISGVATIAGSVVGTQIASRMSAGPWSFVILSVGVLFAAALLALFTRDPAAQTRPPAEPASTLAAGLHLQAQSPAQSWLRTFLSAFRHRDFAYVFAGRILMLLSYNMVLLYLLYILQDYVTLPRGTTPIAGVAFLILVTGSCALVSVSISGFLADRYNRYRIWVFTAGIVGGIGLLLPTFSRTWTTMLVLACVQGLAVGCYLAVDTAVVTLVLPDQGDAGRDLGILNIANAAPPVVAPLLASIVVILGGYQALFPVASCVALLSAATIVRVTSVP